MRNTHHNSDPENNVVLTVKPYNKLYYFTIRLPIWPDSCQVTVPCQIENLKPTGLGLTALGGLGGGGGGGRLS